MTRDQLGARVQNTLNDVGIFYSAADVNDSIQDGYTEVAALTGCILKATSVSLVGGQTYYDFGSLIPDFHAVTAIFNPQLKRCMSPLGLRQLEEMRDDWELANGSPFCFWPVNFRFVAIYPKLTTSVGTLYVFYRAHANVLTGGDAPQIPELNLDTIEHYVQCDLQEQAEEFTKAKLEFEQYIQGIKDLKKASRSFRMPDLMHRLS